jgi:hypothetical protein
MSRRAADMEASGTPETSDAILQVRPRSNLFSMKGSFR